MRLTKELLFTLYDYSLGVAPEDDPPSFARPGPSAEDIETIEASLDTRLPSLLVELAQRPTFPGGWFADLTAPSVRHILEVNEYFWKDGGIPEDYAVLNMGFDGDCDCVLRRDARSDPDTAWIFYLSAGDCGEGLLVKPRLIASNFEQYLLDYCLTRAWHLGGRKRRRRVRRLMAEIDWTRYGLLE